MRWLLGEGCGGLDLDLRFFWYRWYCLEVAMFLEGFDLEENAHGDGNTVEIYNSCQVRIIAYRMYRG